MKNLLSILFVLVSTFASAQLTNGLIALFPFDQNYNDLSSNQILLNPTGTSFTSDRSGVPGQGLALGNQNYITFADPSIKVQLPITMSVWVNIQSFSTFNTILMSDNVYNNYYGYWLNIAGSTGQVGVHIAGGLGGANSGNRRSFLTNDGLTLNTWHHIVAIINGAQDMQIYIDCQLQNGTYSGTGSTNMLYSNADSGIGYYIGNSTNTNGAFLQGSMDQFAIWNRVLSPAEILSLCDKSNTLTIDEKDLQLSLAPNPFNDEVVLNCTQPGVYSIFDLQGKLLQSGTVDGQGQQLLNLSHLSSGSYLFELSQNGSVQSKQIIKL
ncbi:MAG: LamG-like jellyroll fold domain-containing protein [Flavobacteriia bacterium]|jgi:hypothetical protein